MTSCRVLLQSSLATEATLTLLDSTQISNPPPGFVLRLILSLRRFLTYLVRFERQKPDVILVFSSAGASLVEKGAMVWYARARGVPSLMFPRGGVLIDASRRSTFTRNWVRIALHGARAILCQGPAWQRFVVNTLGFNPQDAPIIPNWTATPALLAIGQRRSYQKNNRPVRLLFLGWVEREKGIFELIEACRRLADTYRFELNIVGEGNAGSRARDIVERKRLESIVHFSGWLNASDVERAYSEADVLVLPSWAEGLPNVMIEAMATRLAVIVSAVGNIPDMVVDGHEAMFVTPQDVGDLESKLARVISEPVLRRQLGDAAFSMVERQFGVEQAANRILAAVDRVLD